MSVLPFAPLPRETFGDGIVEQIRRQIEAGVLKPGDRLPPERELCQRFGVSRTAVREALRALALIGLVEIRPGDGLYVGTRTGEFFVRPLTWGLLLERMRQTRNDAKTFALTDMEFHVAVAEAAHNSVAVHLVRTLVNLLLPQAQIHAARPGVADRAIAAHEAIYAALIAADAARAEAATLDHFLNTEYCWLEAAGENP